MTCLKFQNPFGIYRFVSFIKMDRCGLKISSP